ncbi:MAG: GNAT family N-acetyltransferase [Candidatus Thermoplasmatota archaeon]|nr:GNAT family N-acetyltransferase [Candidatus Thermoplasmatota archaeon]
MDEFKKTLVNINNHKYIIDKIETFEKLSEIKSDWERIFNLRQEIPLLFSFEVFRIYYELIIKNFNKVKMEIYVIKNENNKIVAIFPFTFEIKKYFSFLLLRELLVKDEYLIGFYYFLIDPEENPEVIFEIFFKYLKEKRRKWDIINIYSIAEDEKFLKVFKSIVKKYYKIDESETNTLVIDCHREFEDYIKNDLDSKDIRELTRKCRRLDEQGIVMLVEIKEPQEIEAGLSCFYEIEDSGWKGTGQTSLKRSYYGEFYQKLALNLAREDKFRLYFLKVNNEYVAGIYAVIDHGILYLIKIGYSNAFSAFSPSNVLFYRVFEKLFTEKKIVKIDFYGPYYHYQKIFGKQTRKINNIIIYNRKVLPTINYIFLKILRKCKYPFQDDSIRGKIFAGIKKHFLYMK